MADNLNFGGYTQFLTFHILGSVCGMTQRSYSPQWQFLCLSRRKFLPVIQHRENIASVGSIPRHMAPPWTTQEISPHRHARQNIIHP